MRDKNNNKRPIRLPISRTGGEMDTDKKRYKRKSKNERRKQEQWGEE